MNIKTMTKDAVVELLRYLADREEFHSIEELSGSDMTVPQVRAVLREIAVELQKEDAATSRLAPDSTKITGLSKHSKKIISSLSTSEERKLLEAFGLIDER